MKNRSWLSKVFFGEKILIDKGKLNYKQIQCYEWDRFCRWFTNFCLCLTYNLIFAGVWYGVATSQSETTNITIINSILAGGQYSLMALGHGLANVGQWAVNKFTKEKTRKDMVDSGNPIPKRSGTSIAILIFTLLPAFVWLIGRIVITFKCRRYKNNNNGSLETEAMRRFNELAKMKVQKDGLVEAFGEVAKNFTQKS